MVEENEEKRGVSEGGEVDGGNTPANERLGFDPKRVEDKIFEYYEKLERYKEEKRLARVAKREAKKASKTS